MDPITDKTLTPLDPIQGHALHEFSCQAMATVFEIAVIDNDEPRVRQAVSEAFLILERLELELSRYLPSSDIAHINALSPGEYIRIGVSTVECLKLAAMIHHETAGAFDVTIGPALDWWRAHPDAPVDTTDPGLAEACDRIGLHLLEFYEDGITVGVKSPGLRLDLGALGKGYAVDLMAQHLRQWEISSALVHGGQSSVYALGAPPGRPAWRIGVRNPLAQDQILGAVSLRDRSLSGSGLQLKGRHIIDPRTGRPAVAQQGAWAIAETAAISDAVSTAFMVMTVDEIKDFCDRHHPNIAGCIRVESSGEPSLQSFGGWSFE